MTIDARKGALSFALGTALAALLLAASPARADVLSEMGRFWQGAAVNTTGPTAFHGQASGHWTLGNLYLRSPVRSEQIATVNLPSFRAGCGGIDAFAGAFSFINSDQLIAFGRPSPERRRLRLRACPGDHLAGDRRDHGEAPGAGAVDQQPEHELLRDRAGAGRRALVEERPGERVDLRGHRHVAGHLLGLRRGQARLRRGRPAQLDPGVGLRRDGRPGAGQRQLRLEGDPGVVVPGGRHAARRVRHGGDRHADRDGADLGCGHFRPQGADSSSRWRWIAVLPRP